MPAKLTPEELAVIWDRNTETAVHVGDGPRLREHIEALQKERDELARQLAELRGAAKPVRPPCPVTTEELLRIADGLGACNADFAKLRALADWLEARNA